MLSLEENTVRNTSQLPYQSLIGTFLEMSTEKVVLGGKYNNKMHMRWRKAKERMLKQ
jgi:hypothetical protein